MLIAILDTDRTQTDFICQVMAAARHECHLIQAVNNLSGHLQQIDCRMLVMELPATGSVVDVLCDIRQNLPTSFPVMLLASHSDQDEIVAAIEAGANDYLIKPIRRGELLTRVQTLLKRAYPEQLAAQQTHFGIYTFEEGSNRLTRGSQVIDVTQKEFNLALLFFRHLGRPLSRAFIRDAIWTQHADIPSRTIDTHVSRVRSKLGLRPENGFKLAPVYSYGYKLEQHPK